MSAANTRHLAVCACVLLFYGFGAAPAVSAEEVLVPRSSADYGSGYTTGGGVLYPGGIPGMGLWLGQPNPQVRNDRAVVRFSIWPHLLLGRPVDSAALCFAISAFGAADGVHEIEVTHLAYPANTLSVNDMLNSRVDLVAVVSVRKDAPTDKEYVIDVTQQVNADIRAGSITSSYRFRDVTAETQPRVGPADTYGVCLSRLLQLRMR